MSDHTHTLQLYSSGNTILGNANKEEWAINARAGTLSLYPASHHNPFSFETLNEKAQVGVLRVQVAPPCVIWLIFSFSLAGKRLENTFISLNFFVIFLRFLIVRTANRSGEWRLEL